MVIAKPEWFKRRKYSGWGATPANWKGWIYIGVIVAIIFGFQALPFWSTTVRIVFTVVMILFLAIDTIHVMMRLTKDEREKIHEAKAERNALWAIIIVLAAGLAYQAAVSAVKQEVAVDWVIVAALVAALVTKAVSNFYLDKKD